MATTATDRRVGGHPTDAFVDQRELAETAIFEVGEGEAFIVHVVNLLRSSADDVRLAREEVQHMREALERASKHLVRMETRDAGIQHVVSVRLTEIGAEREHIRTIAARCGVALEVAR